MTVISEISFEVFTNEGVRTLAAGQYQINNTVKAHTEEVGWMPGRMVVITSGNIDYYDNFICEFWLLFALAAWFSFLSGVRTFLR